MARRKVETVKCMFAVETDGGELPLRFNCIGFGTCAERAGQLTDGDEIFISGRMTASAYAKAMTLVVNSIEILAKQEIKND